MKKSYVTIVTLYEAISNLCSAMILGCIVGVIASVMIGSLFMQFVEMPFQLIVTNSFFNQSLAPYFFDNRDDNHVRCHYCPRHHYRSIINKQ